MGGTKLVVLGCSSSLLGGHNHHHRYYPSSPSNAPVAAFKRAQAHQRHGSVESQQQPVLELVKTLAADELGPGGAVSPGRERARPHWRRS
jgi:hypothetical protein